uniref:Enoyl-CoA hydratase domain-containing protein 3, mitochondrial n=1 Tax=Strongyloides venezuelensis TaxID=75913 RepID=A0A0K0G2C7_STRVS
MNILSLSKKIINRSLITTGSRLCSTEPLKKDCLDREIYHGSSTVRLVMNSPKNRNALSLEMLNTLYQELFYINKINKVRSVIIAGEGPAFSAGHDLKELTTEKGSEYHKEVFSRCTQLMKLIHSMQIPIIAEVNGVAAAAGLQLALSCDIVIASDKSKFSVPGVKAGLFCHTPGIPLVRNIPQKIAMGMLFTGRPLDAEEAMKAGMVTKIVPEDQVKFEALSYAEDIQNLSKSVISLGKTFAQTQVELSLNDAYRYGEAIMVENLKLVDTQEGIKAFIEKRKPHYTHENGKVNDKKDNDSKE